jgi:hypothetical protein
MILRSLRRVLLLGFASSLAWAGPPYQTDDPEPVGYHHFELFLAWTQTRFGGDANGSLPQLALNYGAAPGLQLAITLPYAYDRPSTGPARSGPGDTIYGAKYCLAEETAGRPMISMYPQLQTGSGDASRGLGMGGNAFFLPVWLQKNWGRWQLNGGGGYWFSRAPGIHNYSFTGVQIQNAVSDHWTLGAEVFHSGEMSSGQGSSTGFNLGVVNDLDEHNHLMLALGRGLVHASSSNEGSVYAAYLRTW